MGGSGSISVQPNPAAPYLYLPKSVCDAIARHVPVTHSSDFNLYLWDTTHPAYAQMIGSPHYMNFTFRSTAGESSSINVPFALLSLNLTSPVGTEDTPYFPCRPFEAADGGPPQTLGRAFLQAAFLAQNWQTSKVFLAQAPGPQYQSEYPRTIETGDTTLGPVEVAPVWDWESSWSTTLKALPASEGSKTSKTPDTLASKSGTLSTGAIVGIVIGIVFSATLAALSGFRALRRRRRGSAWLNPDASPPVVQTSYYYHHQANHQLGNINPLSKGGLIATPAYEADSSRLAELDGVDDARELEGEPVTLR